MKLGSVLSLSAFVGSLCVAGAANAIVVAPEPSAAIVRAFVALARLPERERKASPLVAEACKVTPGCADGKKPATLPRLKAAIAKVKLEGEPAEDLACAVARIFGSDKAACEKAEPRWAAESAADLVAVSTSLVTTLSAKSCQTLLTCAKDCDAVLAQIAWVGDPPPPWKAPSCSLLPEQPDETFAAWRMRAVRWFRPYLRVYLSKAFTDPLRRRQLAELLVRLELASTYAQ